MSPVESQEKFSVGPVGNSLADRLAAALAQEQSLENANEEARDEGLILPDFGEPDHELVDLAAQHGALAVGQVYPGSPRLMQPQPQKKTFQGECRFGQEEVPTPPTNPAIP